MKPILFKLSDRLDRVYYITDLSLTCFNSFGFKNCPATFNCINQRLVHF